MSEEREIINENTNLEEELPTEQGSQNQNRN